MFHLSENVSQELASSPGLARLLVCQDSLRCCEYEYSYVSRGKKALSPFFELANGGWESGPYASAVVAPSQGLYLDFSSPSIAADSDVSNMAVLSHTRRNCPHQFDCG